MVTRPKRSTGAPTEASHSKAFAIHVGRNLVVQALGIAMVSMVGLTVLPWPIVLGWTLVTVATLAAEDRLLRLVTEDGRHASAAGWRASALRIFATTLYAAAAFALITRGDQGAGARMFGFALISASMVHALMRYYRSPRMMLASLAPHLLILGWVSFTQARAALLQGEVLGAVVCSFTILLFAVQIWTARAQLAGAWTELMGAREAAEERKRAAEAANVAKSQFLTTMSHELRTPLHAVLGMVQALNRDGLTRAQRERVQVIRRSSETLLSLLNDLLDLSRIEAGALQLEVAEFDLEHLVRGVAAAYRPLAERKGLTFEFDLTETARGRYLGDASRIRRILYSLCDNAVKFTQTGGVTLEVSRQAGQVAFCVRDTGDGIAGEHLDRLFDGFFQADSTLSRSYGGAGVGLAVCHELATLLGGVVEVSSELGNGSSFIVRLPLDTAGSLAEPETVGQLAVQTNDPAELRVLAAEDNSTNQLVLKTLLAQAGISPTFVVSGREALSAWDAQTWDIVLMDIQMPDMNGIEATRAIRLREQENGRPRTPIVAVTANVMVEQVAAYIAAGMDGVVPKPFEASQLFGTMEQALSNAEAAVEPERQCSAA